MAKPKTEAYKELEREYKKLAKRADQRLVRLEALAESGEFKSAVNMAYRRAIHDIKQWGGEGATRFNQKQPENTQQLQAKINDIKQFLEASTSTKRGIVTHYKGVAETINQKYGTQFTWSSMANFYQSELSTILENKVAGSGTLIRALGKIYRNKDKIIEQIKNSDKAHINVEDEVLDEAVQTILDELGTDVTKLF